MSIVEARTFEVDEHAVLTTPRFALADDDGGQDLLAVVRFAFLDGDHDHISRGAGGQAVKPCTPTLHTDNAKLPRARIVRTVEPCASWQAQADRKLIPAVAAARCAHQHAAKHDTEAFNVFMDMWHRP